VNRPRTDGRPDLRDHKFGISRLKRFPPYVYSLLGGMLVHRVTGVEAWWYEPVERGECLERLESPRLIIHTACGQWFLAGVGRVRARTCALPKPGAVECGRCAGTGAVFDRITVVWYSRTSAKSATAPRSAFTSAFPVSRAISARTLATFNRREPACAKAASFPE